MIGLERAHLTVLAGVLFGALLSGGNALRADQTDPRLPQLFSDLGDAANAQQARGVEQQIWTIWFASANSNALESVNEARAAAESGAVGKAMALFDGVVTNHPSYAEGWNQRAIMRYLTGDVGGSLEDIDQVLALEPRHFGALSGRGQCYLRLERYREALNAFENALSINPWIESTVRQIEMLKAYVQQQQTPI